MTSILGTPNLRIESGERFIIESGLAFTFTKNSEITLILGFDDKSELKFQFLFEDDETGKQNIEAKNDENLLEIKCRNFNNPLGTGLKEALRIGDYLGKNLYLTFCVYGTKTQKKLEYCFFMDK